jgi:hypothetical protein
MEFPVVSFIIGMVNGVAKIAYGVGYSRHPKYRVLGALISDLVIVAGLVMSILSLCYRLNTPTTLGPGIVVLILVTELLVIGFAFGGGNWKSVFNDDYLKQNFGEDHKLAFG